MRQIFAFGLNLNGQLALSGTPESELPQINQPTLSPSLSSKEIVQIASGSDVQYALNANGELFTWGKTPQS